jgi:hypothetical protein
MATKNANAPKDVIVGDYYLVKHRIGSGSFGDIYLGALGLPSLHHPRPLSLTVFSAPRLLFCANPRPRAAIDIRNGERVAAKVVCPDLIVHSSFRLVALIGPPLPGI